MTEGPIVLSYWPFGLIWTVFAFLCFTGDDDVQGWGCLLALVLSSPIIALANSIRSGDFVPTGIELPLTSILWYGFSISHWSFWYSWRHEDKDWYDQDQWAAFWHRMSWSFAASLLVLGGFWCWDHIHLVSIQ